MTAPTTSSVEFERGRHAAVTEILGSLDILKQRCLSMTDSRASACLRIGLAAASMKIVDIENRWTRDPSGPFHDRMAP